VGFADIFSCKGKVALVTGAASGLGFVFAEAMAEAGADVACADIDEKGLAEVVGVVTAKGQGAIAIKCDVSKEVEVKDMVRKTVDAFGTLDILFNNAGAGQVPTPLHELDTDEWKQLIEVDLHGAFYCAREALKVMVPKRSGKIIITSSVWGWTGSSVLQSCPA